MSHDKALYKSTYTLLQSLSKLDGSNAEPYQFMYVVSINKQVFNFLQKTLHIFVRMQEESKLSQICVFH